MGAACACHHLMCNLRMILRRPASEVLRSARMTEWISYLVQSADLESPVPESAQVLRSRCSVSGPRGGRAPDADELEPPSLLLPAARSALGLAVGFSELLAA